MTRIVDKYNLFHEYWFLIHVSTTSRSDFRRIFYQHNIGVFSLAIIKKSKWRTKCRRRAYENFIKKFTDSLLDIIETWFKDQYSWKRLYLSTILVIRLKKLYFMAWYIKRHIANYGSYKQIFHNRKIYFVWLWNFIKLYEKCPYSNDTDSFS